MLKTVWDINSPSNCKRLTQDFVRRLKSTGQPSVLTVNSVSGWVVQSVESYQKLLDRVEYLERVQGILGGLEKCDRRQGQPAEEVLTELRMKLTTTQTA